MTTDPKLNPRPKPEEIVLCFKNDFETLLSQAGLPADKQQYLLDLYQRVQRSKAPTDQAWAQKSAFLKLSFLIELLHYYENQNTEPADVVFAQRLPALIEQLALAGAQDQLEEKPIAEAEALLTHVVNPDHRHMIINNVGKGGGTGTTLKFVLRLREQPVIDQDQLIPDFVRHILPSQRPPAAEVLMGMLTLIKPELQKPVLSAMLHSDRIRKDEAEVLVKILSSRLGFPDFVEQAKAQPAMAPEIERQMAWNRIKDLMNRRADTATIAATFRERLHEHYNGEEMKQSWITLTETDPISLIRIFCQLPYLSNGKTDPIARTVLETYVTRLTHEKYAATYNKIVNSLRNMFRAKADSPTLLNFLALVRWVSAEAADKLCTDIGMPVPARNA